MTRDDRTCTAAGRLQLGDMALGAAGRLAMLSLGELFFEGHSSFCLSES